jgi:signal transduction histidine kinase
LIENNKDLRQFSYITSHNLRGPIANLLGLTSLLDNYSIKDPTLVQILAGIKKATNMFDETIKDLSTVLNVKDRPSIPREIINLRSVYDKLLEHNESLIKEADAKIKINVDEDIAVDFNKAYVESIFLNLLTNAIKYKSPLRQLNIEITTEDFADRVEVKFKDNGLGIDLFLYKEKLFRLYQRFHTHTEGKGFGLFLIKSQMETLGGTIDIESTVNEGTTFILNFRKNNN